jgi:hypothetical protein
MADNVNRDRGTDRRERTRRERVEGGRNQERDFLEILYCERPNEQGRDSQNTESSHVN